jgi:hypothetical protein
LKSGEFGWVFTHEVGFDIDKSVSVTLVINQTEFGFALWASKSFNLVALVVGEAEKV